MNNPVLDGKNTRRKKMKKIFAILVVVAVLCGSVAIALAEESEKEKILTGYFNTGIYNKYVCSGALLFNHMVIQPALGIVYEPWAVYAEKWFSYSPKGGLNSDPGDESDGTVGWTPEYKGFKFDVGYSYFNLVSLKNTTGDLHDFYANLSAPAVYGVTPSVNLDFNVPQDKDILEGGVIWAFNLEVEPEIFGQKVNIIGTAVGHDGAYGAEPELVSSLNLRLATTIAILKNLELTPEVNFQKRIGKDINNGGLSKDLIWYGIKVNYPFDIL